jgi:ABC-2 type transport system permease protein
VNGRSGTHGRTSRWASWRRRSLTGHAALVFAYAKLEVVRSLRSRQFQLMAVVLPVGLYLVYTEPGLGRQPDAVVDGTTWKTYAMISMAALGALGAGLAASGSRLAAERASGWVRTLALAPLPRADMLAGRVVAGVVIAVLPIVLVLGTAVVGRGVGLAPGSWLQLILSLWTGALAFSLLGVVVGLVLDRDAAVGVIVVYLGFAFLGGLLEPIGTLPAVIATIGRVLPSFLVGDLGRLAILRQSPSAQDITVLAAESLAFASWIAWSRRDE